MHKAYILSVALFGSMRVHIYGESKSVRLTFNKGQIDLE